MLLSVTALEPVRYPDDASDEEYGMSGLLEIRLPAGRRYLLPLVDLSEAVCLLQDGCAVVDDDGVFQLDLLPGPEVGSVTVLLRSRSRELAAIRLPEQCLRPELSMCWAALEDAAWALGTLDVVERLRLQAAR